MDYLTQAGPAYPKYPKFIYLIGAEPVKEDMLVYVLHMLMLIVFL